MAANKDRYAKQKGRINWSTWKYSTRIALESRGLYDYVTGDVEIPTEPEANANEKTRATYKKKKKDSKLQTQGSRDVIVQRIDEKILYHVLSCETAQEIWDKLSTVFELSLCFKPHNEIL